MTCLTRLARSGTPTRKSLRFSVIASRSSIAGCMVKPWASVTAVSGTPIVRPTMRPGVAHTVWSFTEAIFSGFCSDCRSSINVLRVHACWRDPECIRLGASKRLNILGRDWSILVGTRSQVWLPIVGSTDVWFWVSVHVSDRWHERLVLRSHRRRITNIPLVGNGVRWEASRE